MSQRADELDSSQILTVIRHELNKFQSARTTLPELELRGVWINGSFGGNDATETSDVDITLEVGVSESEYDRSPLYVADDITDFAGPLATALLRVLPAHPDVSVIPSAEVVSDADLDVPTAKEYVRDTQEHGGYDTVFDVLAEEYVRI